MHMYLTHDRALIDHSRSRVEPTCWSMLLPLGGEFRLLVRTLLGRGIHVSPMSGTWLRTHEAAYDKHGADV